MGRPKLYESNQARSAAYNATHKNTQSASSAAFPMAVGIANASAKRKKFAKGGMVGKSSADDRDDYGSPMSIADEIRKRSREEPEDDTVDLAETNAEDLEPDFDEMNELAADEPGYDVDDELSDQPMDSIGRDLDDGEDDDMVTRIRKRRMSQK